MDITIHIKDAGEHELSYSAELSERPEPGGKMTTSMLALIGIRTLLETGLTSTLGGLATQYVQAGGDPDRFASILKDILSEITLPMLDRAAAEEVMNKLSIDGTEEA